MRIAADRKLPTHSQLIEVLRTEFSQEYNYYLTGLAKKEVMVRKSTFVGVQVAVYRNEININASIPSLADSALFLFISIYLDALLFFFYKGQWEKLEKEVTCFLQRKYT